MNKGNPVVGVLLFILLLVSVYSFFWIIIPAVAESNRERIMTPAKQEYQEVITEKINLIKTGSDCYLEIKTEKGTALLEVSCPK